MGQPVFFRSDIEGLRAVAVLLVVACHAGVPGMAGGYVGVDVFFVISGYLITWLLQQEFAAGGRIDWAAFYARRIRRLLPAFALMMVFVLLGLYLLASPLEQPLLVRSVLAAGLYISNLHFAWQSLDYWADSAKQDPLLHTWSLGVEEQFYLVWPLLLGLLLWLGKRLGQRFPVAILILGLSLLSFVFAVAEVEGGQPTQAFFYPWLRAWEFGVGACLVLFAASLARLALRWRLASWGRPHQLLGIAALLAAAILYDDKTAFPGLAALLPVLATAWLLWGGSLTPPAGACLLDHPWLQWLGRHSYGWYLWHWPLLVFGLMVFPEAGLGLRLALMALALLAAAFSYRFLESPLRWQPRFRSGAFALGLALAVAGITVGAGLQMAAAASARAAQPEYERLLALRGRVPALYKDGCDPGPEGIYVKPCRGGAASGARTVVLLGDSHAGQWASAFDAIARAQGWQLLLYTKSACPMVDADFHYERLGRNYDECRIWRQAVLKEIATLRPGLVVVSGSENYPFTAQQWRSGEASALSALVKSSGQLLILRDTPLPRINIPHCLARRIWQPGIYRSACDFAVGSADSQRLDAMRKSEAAQLPNTFYLDLTSAICGAQRCSVMAGDTVKFRDGSHLSDAYVQQLVPVLRQGMAGLGLL